jgi:CheY-like chemotaxis protein
MSLYDNNNLLITDEELLKGTETLMIVDDELMIITAFKTILNKYGYTVDIFKDGAAGLAAFKKAPIKYNLIVTDQTMPIMTGSDMAKYILEINSDIPILLCTGHTERIAKKQWKAIGIKRVLNKPVLARDLLIAIRTILNK